MIEEAVLDLRELNRQLLLEIQFVLFQYLGYDTYTKPWFQNLCARLTNHSLDIDFTKPLDEDTYMCSVCGKRDV
jgi:hypothetical protein